MSSQCPIEEGNSERVANIWSDFSLEELSIPLMKWNTERLGWIGLNGTKGTKIVIHGLAKRLFNGKYSIFSVETLKVYTLRRNWK